MHQGHGHSSADAESTKVPINKKPHVQKNNAAFMPAQYHNLIIGNLIKPGRSQLTSSQHLKVLMRALCWKEWW